ncbi:MAG: creatininase [Deltaproteobacteria bacterium]|nr:MAG: creatininase [Deltaproteobacteria bacterium]
MEVSRMTMKEFAEGLKRTRIALLPLGSTEEHGNHLPLDTDTLQVFHAAKLATAMADFFLCPPLSYGFCRSTSEHPGTISISPETLRGFIVDIASSLYRQGIRGLILASGHAGGIHMSAIEESAERILGKFYDMEVAVLCEYHLAADAGADDIVETEDDGHAGENETCRIMAIHPELVKGTSPEEYPRFEKPFLSRDKRSRWPGGVWGDPSKATPEKGVLLYEARSKKLASIVKEMRARLAAREVSSRRGDA